MPTFAMKARGSRFPTCSKWGVQAEAAWTATDVQAYSPDRWGRSRPLLIFYASILALWLKAEHVLAVHRTDSVPVQADMGRGRMGVAPHALHQLAGKNALTAGCHEQGVDRLDQ